jgi:hypothetical protein
MKEEKKEENFNSGQEKLSETVELWRDGILLTFLLCLFFSIISGYYNDDSTAWALLNCAAVSVAAWLWLPGIIDRFSDEEAKDGDT